MFFLFAAVAIPMILIALDVLTEVRV